MLQVGVVGLGTMGGAMARHLLSAGFDVSGYDVAPARTAELEASGGRAAATPAEVAERSEVVVLSLPSVTAFDEVVSGRGGLSQALGGGQTVVETSTLPLEVKERGREQLHATGREMLDCPVSGTGAQMAAGDVVFYASGPADALAAARPVLEACGRAIFELGEFGAASRLKLVANLLVAVHNAASAEALLLAERSGVDPAAALPALLAGAGSSKILELRGPMMVERRYHPATMKVEVFQKDVDIITAFAEAVHCPVPVFAAAAERNLVALECGYADADTASVHAALAALVEP